jgi:colicin import membrane protein
MKQYKLKALSINIGAGGGKLFRKSEGKIFTEKEFSAKQLEDAKKAGFLYELTEKEIKAEAKAKAEAEAKEAEAKAKAEAEAKEAEAKAKAEAEAKEAEAKAKAEAEAKEAEAKAKAKGNQSKK